LCRTLGGACRQAHQQLRPVRDTDWSTLEFDIGTGLDLSESPLPNGGRRIPQSMTGCGGIALNDFPSFVPNSEKLLIG
jgi:hypothetical protein